MKLIGEVWWMPLLTNDLITKTCAYTLAILPDTSSVNYLDPSLIYWLQNVSKDPKEPRHFSRMHDVLPSAWQEGTLTCNVQLEHISLSLSHTHTHRHTCCSVFSQTFLSEEILFPWLRFGQMIFVFRRVSTFTINFHRSVSPGPERYSLWKVKINKVFKPLKLDSQQCFQGSLPQRHHPRVTRTVIRTGKTCSAWWKPRTQRWWFTKNQNQKSQIAPATLKATYFIIVRTLNWVLKSQK